MNKRTLIFISSFGLLALTLVIILMLVTMNTSQSSEGEDNSYSTQTPSSGSANIATVSNSNVETKQTIASALEGNQNSHVDSDDYEIDDTQINLIELNNQNQQITTAGVYQLSGTISNGQLTVEIAKDENIWLILNNVSISNNSGPAINIIQADKTTIILADGSKNTLKDGSAYSDENKANSLNAVIHSKGDLTIAGSGKLNISGNYNDGINSTDGLVIDGGNIKISAVDDGIRGKDYVIVQSGNIDVSAGGDGIKSDNEEDSDRGFIYISGGTLSISASGDSISATTDVLVSGGDMSMKSSGMSTATTTSNKGIKADKLVIIENGDFDIETEDDAIHSNDTIVVNGGDFTISTRDDGIHADSMIAINSGKIVILKSYEGIESAVILINNGDIDITSSDDGINISSGSDGSGAREGPGGRGQDTFADDGSNYLEISGGEININANGDGLDINGGVNMIGGNLYIEGPTANNNGALDYNTGFTLTGGTIVAVGSSGMAQNVGNDSTQNSVLINLTNAFPAGTKFVVKSSSGQVVLNITPSKVFQSVLFSSVQLKQGETYQIYVGGNLYETVTISTIVTNVGQSGMMGPGGRRGF